MSSPNSKAELHLTGPTHRPGGYALHAIVERCLAMPSPQAVDLHVEYENRGWLSVASFVPSDLDTRGGMQIAVQKGSAFLRQTIEYHGKYPDVAWMDSPEFVIGTYCVRDSEYMSNIWRGIGFWKIPGLTAPQ